jgi:gamma-glutamyltranspeptidase/glutathione hydrolase
MCPTILLRAGKPVMALGGTGGRMIPNALYKLLAHFVGLGDSIEDAVAAPRVHTDGNLDLTMERKWPEAEMQYLKEVGFNVKLGNNANVHVLSMDAQTGQFRVAAR